MHTRSPWHTASFTLTLRRIIAVGASICALAAAPAVAIDYTWSSSSVGGLWSGTTNWTPNATVTGTNNTATLGNTTADRTVTYDNDASITNIGSIIFSQTSAFTNLLDVQKNLTVANTITLAASNGGLARLLVSPVSGTTLTSSTLTAAVNVNAGGMLSLGAYNPSGTNSAGVGNLTGNVNVAGGSFVVENGTKLGAATGATNYLNGTLTMSSGTFIVSGSNFSDRRLYTSGLNVTGGDSNINGALYTNGATNTFTPTTFAGVWTLGLGRSGDQTITVNTGTSVPSVAVRGTGVKTFTSTVSGTNIGLIDLNDQNNASAGSRTTLKLGSNLTLAAGAGLPTTANYSATSESGTRADVGIDADTFTLNLASNSGVFTPNVWSNASGSAVQYWFLSGTTGTIIANGFKFDSTKVATSVGPGLVLESRAGNNVANVLSLGSGTGAIDPTSVFRYAGSAAVETPSTLASTRAIGDVEVTSGALKILSLSAMQALRVNGGTLDLAGNSLVVTTLSGSSGGTITSGSSARLTLTASSAVNSTFAGVIQNGSGTVALTKADAGMLTLAGSVANTFSGLATVSSGTLELNKTAGVNAVGGNLQVNAGATLRLAAANQIADTGTVTINAGGTWNLNGQNETITNLTQAGVSGTAPTVTLGSGTLSLNAVSSTGTAGSPSTTLGGPGGTLRFVPSGSTQPTFSTNYQASVDINSAVQIDAAGLTFNLGTWSTAVSGKISGTGSVVKSSQGGGLTLSNGSNDYSGGTQWTGFGADWGQMSVSASGALGSGTVTLNGGGNTTNWTAGNSGNDPSVFVFTGNTTQANNFSLTSNSPIAVSNPRGSGASTDTVLLTGSFALGSNTLFLRGRGTGTISGPIAGSGGLTKIDGLSTWALSGSNTFTGTTTVSNGTLNLSNQNALQNSTLTMGGGSLVFGSAVSGNAFTVGGLAASTSGTGYDIALCNNAGTPAPIALTVGGNNASTTYAAVLSGSGSLTKIGTGTLALSGSNTYTGATSIAAGILSITGTSGLAGTSGVTIAGGAGLTYAGGTATFGKNITVTAGSGTGTITNSGGGLLTLSGNLSKDNSVLRLTGGAFNVTGLITGTTAGASDLVVDAATVTLSNTNSYNGPTFVYGSSTLALGIDNAIPNTSRVELGNATTRGTLSMGTFSDAISQLVFSGSGGILSLSGDKTASAQLATNGALALGSNADLVLTSAGNSAGLYRLISATSITGSFASITGTSAAYQVITSATSIDYQQRAVLGAVAVTNPSAIITGGSAAFTYTVANSALSGGASLGFSSGSLSNIAGTSSGTATAATTSGAISGLVFTGTSVGSGQTGTFTVNAPSAFGTTAATGTVSVDVLNHSLASFTAADSSAFSLDFGTYDKGTWSGGSGGNGALGFSVWNIASGGFLAADTAGLALYDIVLTSGTNIFSTGLTNFANLTAGTSSAYTASVLSPAGLDQGTYQGVYTLKFRDQQNLSGAANTRDLTLTMNVIVVPEPGAIALAGIGIAAAAWALRRRK